MLTSDQIEVLGELARDLVSPITDFLIADIARRIAEAGQLTGTAAYQVWRLQQLGVSQRKLKKELRRRLRVSRRELRRLLTQAAETGYQYDVKKHPYIQAVPFSENTAIQNIVKAAVDMAQEDLTNMVQTIGFVGPDGTADPLTKAYQKACDFAFQKVTAGAQDYTSAIREATRQLAEKGVVTIDYESGIHTSLEAAVRRNIMGGLGLMQERISQQNHDDLGCDGWEISAHAASAPDHEPIQGRQFSDDAYRRLNNSLVRRIGTLNCGHATFPILLGVDKPQYSPEELEQLRQENETGITYGGKHYTIYKATQHQRKLERVIRKQKRRVLVDEATADQEKLSQDQTKLVSATQEYRRFSRAAKLRTQQERIEAAGFGPKQALAAEKEVAKYEKVLYHKDGTIAVTDDWKHKGKVTIPKKYRPNAVVETQTLYKNGTIQIDRTLYGQDSMLKTQIHSGPHNRPDQHKFGRDGAHGHDYVWDSDGRIVTRTPRELLDAERIAHADILRKETY